MHTDRLIDLALEEDLAYGDITSEAIFPADHRSRARIEARQPLIVCGIDVAVRVFQRVDPAVRVLQRAEDGAAVAPQDVVLRIEGPTRAVLAGERTALNFLQRLSGIATLSRQFAELEEPGRPVRIVDTRKTTPGWRALEKYAVRCGGCRNHRLSLGEHVLIKDNHIAAAGSVSAAVQLCLERAPHCGLVVCEITREEQVEEALEAGAGVLLLDNFSPADIRRLCQRIGGRAVVEISGGLNLQTLPDYLEAVAGTEARFSVGALTHSARAADLSLEVEP